MLKAEKVNNYDIRVWSMGYDEDWSSASILNIEEAKIFVKQMNELIEGIEKEEWYKEREKNG